MNQTDGEVGTSAAAKDLLLAELALFEESIWRNEEVGEKRFNFFITLVTAVTGGLVALWTSEKISEDLTTLTWQANFALLIFGLLSFRRMLHRDRVTDQYKRTTRLIRNTYLQLFADAYPPLRGFHVPVPLFPQDEGREITPWKRRRRRILQAGYTQSLAVLNGILLAVVLFWGASWPTGAAVLFGVMFGAFLAWIGSAPHEKKQSK